MKLKEYLGPDCLSFQTDFEKFAYSEDELEQDRYEAQMDSLIRVVRKSFVAYLEDIGCEKFIYLCMLPTHVEDALDNYFLFFDSTEDNAEQIKADLNSIFSSITSEKMSDYNATSFFIMQNCSADLLDRQLEALDAKLKKIVTNGEEEIGILIGNIPVGVGVFHKSRKFKNPTPKTKHVSFWKKHYKQGITFECLYNMFKEL